MASPRHEFCLRTRVVFGAGAVRQAPAECREIRMSRPFVITGRAVREAGLVERVEAALHKEDVAVAGVFDDVPAWGDARSVEKATEEMSRTAADGIVVVGGGSVIDTAKAVNILLVKGGSLADHQEPGVLADAPLVPVLCVPTAAGTGSEVSGFALIRDRKEKRELRFANRNLAATVAILDPEMTLPMPASRTAAAGMAALSHALESVLSEGTQPASEGMALASARRIFASLPKAVKDGKDLGARAEMLVAANLAGIALANSGPGVTRACAEALGAVRDMDYAAAAAVMLPYALRFVLAEAGDKAKPLEAAAGAQDIAAGAASLAADCGLPPSLKELGVVEEDLPALAASAEGRPALQSAPRRAGKKDLLGIFREAFGSTGP